MVKAVKEILEKEFNYVSGIYDLSQSYYWKHYSNFNLFLYPHTLDKKFKYNNISASPISAVATPRRGLFNFLPIGAFKFIKKHRKFLNHKHITLKEFNKFLKDVELWNKEISIQLRILNLEKDFE